MDPALLAEVIAHPDDDAPRLALAAWLRGRDDARAEFITLQCELARLDEDDPRWDQHQLRCRELLGANHDAWTRELCMGRRDEETRFRRGFVYSVDVAPYNFLGAEPHLMAHAPVEMLRFIRSHRRHTQESAVPELLALPSLRRIRRLEWHPSVAPHVSAQLADCPHLGGVRTLFIDHIDTDGLERLLASPALPQLEELGLVRTLAPEGFARVAATDGAARLRRLHLHSNGGHVPGATVLAGSPAFDRLAELTLDGEVLDDAAVARLADAPWLPRLESLRVSDLDLTMAGVARLLGALGPSLRELSLRASLPAVDVLRELVALPQLTGLRSLTLNLDGNDLVAARLLAEAPHLQSLERVVSRGYPYLAGARSAAPRRGGQPAAHRGAAGRPGPDRVAVACALLRLGAAGGVPALSTTRCAGSPAPGTSRTACAACR
jgi:uncharacterized protein (TIGR02996 family)